MAHEVRHDQAQEQEEDRGQEDHVEAAVREEEDLGGVVEQGAPGDEPRCHEGSHLQRGPHLRPLLFHAQDAELRLDDMDLLAV